MHFVILCYFTTAQSQCVSNMLLIPFLVCYFSQLTLDLSAAFHSNCFLRYKNDFWHMKTRFQTVLFSLLSLVTFRRCQLYLLKKMVRFSIFTLYVLPGSSICTTTVLTVQSIKYQINSVSVQVTASQHVTNPCRTKWAKSLLNAELILFYNLACLALLTTLGHRHNHKM